MSNGNQSVQFQATTPVPPLEGITWDSFLLNLHPGIEPIPPWWSRERDRFFRMYLRQNPIFSAISYGRITKIKNLDWRIIADDEALEPLVEQYHALFEQAQFGEGFRLFLELWANDHYNQDNGAFIELVGPGLEQQITIPLQIKPPPEPPQPFQVIAKGPLAKDAITTFAHIDAAQCWRTFNREWPVIYINPWTGQRHILHWSRVVSRSQFTQAIEMGRGIGLSAPSRAFLALDLLRSTEEYTWEKVTGQSPELAIVRGMPLATIRRAFENNTFGNDAKGRVRWKGIEFIAGDIMPAADTGIDLVGLKGVPDGWDKQTEVNIAVNIVALAYGTDARDLGWPATQTGATKADAEVQDIKTSGSGRGDIITDLEEIFNTRLLPSGLRFEFDNKDDLEDKRRADIEQVRANTRSIQILSGELTVDEARQMAAANGDINPAFLEESAVMGSEGSKALAQYPSLRNQFQKQLFTAINRMRRGENGAGPFIREASDLLQTYGTRAYLRGINDGGAAGINTVGQLEENERRDMQTLINQQVGFLSNVSNDVIGGDFNYAMIRARVSLWANKGLDSIYWGGFVAGEANPNLEWVLGQTEKHCTDCLRMNGRVYRAKTLQKYGVVPRADALECKGFQCDCSLIRTDKPVMRGRPPKLTYGGKAVKNARYPDLDFTPPEAVQRALKRGLDLHKQGKTGDGLEPATVAWARRLVKGQAISPERARQMNRFFGRNDRFRNEPRDSAAYASWLLWGGAAGKRWAKRLVRGMES